MPANVRTRRSSRTSRKNRAQRTGGISSPGRSSGPADSPSRLGGPQPRAELRDVQAGDQPFHRLDRLIGGGARSTGTNASATKTTARPPKTAPRPHRDARRTSGTGLGCPSLEEEIAKGITEIRSSAPTLEAITRAQRQRSCDQVAAIAAGRLATARVGREAGRPPAPHRPQGAIGLTCIDSRHRVNKSFDRGGYGPGFLEPGPWVICDVEG